MTGQLGSRFLTHCKTNYFLVTLYGNKHKTYLNKSYCWNIDFILTYCFELFIDSNCYSISLIKSLHESLNLFQLTDFFIFWFELKTTKTLFTFVKILCNNEKDIFDTPVFSNWKLLLNTQTRNGCVSNVLVIVLIIF